MELFLAETREETLIEKLFGVWERSVRATHRFLSDREVMEIGEYVPGALREIPYLIVAADFRHEPVAFMGIQGSKLEMLFLAPEERGKGLGKQLIQYGIEHYGVDELTVNEQNPQARGFYEHLGFRVDRRADTDEQGNPYPILYMRRPKVDV